MGLENKINGSIRENRAEMCQGMFDQDFIKITAKSTLTFGSEM
jgi:hypothetical protein